MTPPPAESKSTGDGAVVCIGVFDGVHAGHRHLLEQVVQRAQHDGLSSVAVTFDRHPLAVVRPDAQPLALQMLEDKVAAIEATGIDCVHVLTFDEDASRQTADQFVADTLVAQLRARHVLIGANFRFGHGAQGDLAALQALGATHGFTAEAVELVDVDSQVVSSTSIRAAIAAGKVQDAARSLGRPHVVPGRVVHGDGRGGSIGVPTANVEPPAGFAVPAQGVYATVLSVDGQDLASVTNIGTRPTFDGHDVTVECHALDLSDLDLYGRDVRVGFVQRLRGEQRFADVDELVAQIHDDIERARDVLDTQSGP